MLVFRPDRFLRGGDHFSFNEQGYAAVRFTEYRENYNHQHQNVRTENGIEYGDLPKFVDYDYTANVARLNAATLAELASAPAPPANVRLIDESSCKTIPLWSGSLHREAWRRLRSSVARYDGAEWQHVKAVGNVTQATLPLSKDNVIFAVRAVDAKGHRSLAVVPVPER